MALVFTSPSTVEVSAPVEMLVAVGGCSGSCGTASVLCRELSPFFTNSGSDGAGVAAAGALSAVTGLPIPAGFAAGDAVLEPAVSDRTAADGFEDDTGPDAVKVCSVCADASGDEG